MDSAQARTSFDVAVGFLSEPALTQPSPSLDPRNISAIPGYDATTSGYVSAAYDAFTTAHANIQAVIDARNKVNENTAWTEDKRLMKIADFASAKQDQATRAMDSARSRLASGIKSLEESLDKPLERRFGERRDSSSRQGSIG